MGTVLRTDGLFVVATLGAEMLQQQTGSQPSATGYFVDWIVFGSVYAFNIGWVHVVHGRSW